MTAILERGRSRAARWSRALSNFAFVLFVVAGLSHYFRFIETPTLLLVLGIAGLLALCGLFLAVVGYARVWNFADHGGLDATIGGLVGLLVLSPFAFAAYGNATHPFINDISTDLSQPPALSDAGRLHAFGANAVMPIGDEAAEAQRQYYPDVVGRRYEMPIRQVSDIVSASINRHGWRLVETRKQDTNPRVPLGEITFEAVAYTALFAFPSDVAIRLSNEGETTFVDMRSASRYGSNDLGDNARRIVAFLDELDTEVGLRAGLPMPDEPAQ